MLIVFFETIVCKKTSEWTIRSVSFFEGAFYPKYQGAFFATKHRECSLRAMKSVLCDEASRVLLTSDEERSLRRISRLKSHGHVLYSFVSKAFFVIDRGRLY